MLSISSYYGKKPSEENIAKVVKVNQMRFYFSYETLVAVHTGTELKVVKNHWGPTTGYHLNAIDGGSLEAKMARIDKGDFDKFISELKLQVVWAPASP